MHMRYIQNNPVLDKRELNEDLRPTTILKGLETLYYDDPERFMPVTLEDIKTGPFFGIDLYVKTSVGSKTRYVLYYKGDDIFSDEKKEDLIRRNIHRLFIPKNGKTRYMQYVEANLKKIILDEMERNEVKVKVAYEVGMNMVQDIFADEIIESKTIDRAMNWVFIMIDFILESDCIFSNLARIMQNDKNIFKHCVNSTVIGLLFAKHTGLDINSMNKLGMGLLFHDIGLVGLKKNNISENNVTKEDSKESAVLQHPLIGVTMLEKTKKFTPETLELIGEHHEYVDGTGYPYNLKGGETNQLAKYARIVDEYDLLITREDVKDSENLHFVVLNKMVNQLKNKLDISLLTSFVKFVGASHRKSNNTSGPHYLRLQDNHSGDRIMANFSL